MVMTERCWNNADSGKLKYSVKGISQCHFVLQKSHYDWPGIEFRPQKSQTVDEPPVITCPLTLQKLVQWGENYFDLVEGSYQSTA